MADVVFILGAGASKKAGAPLMTEFLDVADMLWKTKRVDGDDAGKFRKVFEGIGSLQQIYSKANLDISNVESVFAAFEMGKTLGRFVGCEGSEIDELVAAMRVLIVRTLEETVTFPVGGDNSIRPPKPYDKFVGLVKSMREKWSPERTVAVITFNYDIALDYAFNFEGQPIDYGLPTYDPGPEAVPLLKLHGSLNWARMIDGGQSIIPYMVYNDAARYVQGRVNAARILMGSSIDSINSKAEREVEPEPVIVPPTWNKADYHRGIGEVWSRAANELSEAETIICIGFSLNPTDSFFKYLYSLGTVGDRPLKRFWMFDPKDEEIEQRYLNLLGPAAEQRFEPFGLKFGDAIEEIRNRMGNDKGVWLLN